MASFLGGFQFYRNFFSHSGWRASFRMLRMKKISLSNIFSYAVLLSLFAMLTFVTPPVNASPPTHYVVLHWITNPTFTGDTPDMAVQEYVAYYNSISIWRIQTTAGCQLVISPYTHPYQCPANLFRTETGHPEPITIPVSPRCGPSYIASWNGAELYCPPVPECDGPAQ